jgi:hypothetical protein
MKGLLLLLVLLTIGHATTPDPCEQTAQPSASARTISACTSPCTSLRRVRVHWGIIIFILSAIGAGTGLGGGPLITPVFILILLFGPHDAIPLAQLVIFSASITTIVFRVQERHPEVNRPLIAWDLLILLQAPIICGALFGVLLNYTFPDWC